MAASRIELGERVYVGEELEFVCAFESWDYVFLGYIEMMQEPCKASVVVRGGLGRVD